MPYELESEELELSLEQLDEVQGGLAETAPGALLNAPGNNTLIGLLLPAVQKVR